MDKKIVGIAISMVLLLIAGIGIGHYFFPDRDVIIKEVMEESGNYVHYFDTMQEYFNPFNETDDVTAYWNGSQLYIHHTVPNNLGLHYFHIIFDENGFMTNIEQWRD